MIQLRSITPFDYNDLEEAISKDPYHRDTTTPEFFYLPLTLCNVYYDEKGTILWLRLCSDVHRVVHLDIQFRRNRDSRRNKAAMDWGFPDLIARAKDKFRAFVFESTSPHLINYCTDQLGFKQEENNFLRKDL